MTTPRRASTRRDPFPARAALLAAALLLLAAASPTHAQDGTLDPTFGTGGRVTSGAAAGANATVIDSADRIVVAGELSGNFSVARFTTAGVLDPTFGTGGSVTTDFGGSDVAKAAVLQPDGRIVVAGSSNGNFALARYTTAGVLDPTFGTGGIVTTDFGGNDFANAVALQPGGRIVAAGGINFDNFALARYTTDGVLDPTFGTGGRVTTDFSGRSDRANAMATYPDGRIIVVGTSEAGNFSTAEFALARYTPDGTLDPTFNGSGLVTLNYEWDDELYAVAIDSEQRIVFGGTAFINLAASGNGRGGFNDVNVLVVGRMEPGGALLGYTEFFDFDSYLSANSIAIQADDKILAAGVKSSPGVHDFILVRLNRDGSDDETFGSFGYVQTDFGGGDTAYAMDLDSAGRIVVAGASSGNVAVARYLNTPPPSTACGPGSPALLLTDFATTDGEEFFDLTNVGPVPLDLTDCTALSYNVFTGRAALTFDLDGVTLDPAESYRIGNAGVPDVDIVAPDGFLPEPWGFGFVKGDLAPGETAFDLRNRIVTSVIYLEEDAVYLFYHSDLALEASYCAIYAGRIALSSPEVCPPSVAARRGGGAAAFLAEARALQASLGRTADEAATASSLPSEYALGAAYPNPAGGRTTVAYDLPEASPVRLAVYDALGRTVAVLVEGEVEAGRHAASLAAGSLAPGVYLVRLTAGPFAATQRVTVVR